MDLYSSSLILVLNYLLDKSYPNKALTVTSSRFRTYFSLAKKDPKWRAAMLDEMESMKINKVWDLVYLLPGLLGSLVRDRPQVCET